jgi:hypothetical protein
MKDKQNLADKDPHAVALGRRGGKIGGKVRAAADAFATQRDRIEGGNGSLEKKRGEVGANAGAFEAKC